MSEFNWALISGNHSGKGPGKSVQFTTSADSNLTGSTAFTYHTGSGTLVVSGTLEVSGTMIPVGTLSSKGDVLPYTNKGHSLGSSALRWANVYTGDLHLKNERGDWTIIEEEDYLCVVNNKTGKKYKMVLEEIKDK